MTLYGANGYVRYTYDNLDRIETAWYNSTGLLLTYSYDYMGNVVQKKVTNADGTTEYATYRYEYDSLGRPIRFFETLGDEIVQQSQYTYDSKNRTTSVSYFDGAKMHTETIVYNDDEGGVVERYDYGADGAIGYFYDGLNRVYRKFFRRIGTDTADGWNVYYTYKDGTGENQTTSLISRLNYKFDESTNYILNYTYDNIGNITEITDASGKTVGRYLYDTNGQLVLEEIGNKTKVYTYDTFGNILRETQYHSTGYASPSEAHAAGMDEFAYTYGYTNSDWKDLLTSYRGQTITYDAAGNPLSYYNGQSYTFTWEDGNQLASATVGGKTIDFTYNSNGIRTKKNISGSATYYYRLNGTKVVEMEVASVSSSTTDRYVFIYDADGNPHEIHKYAAGATTPTKYFYVLNLQGDVIQLRDTSNAVVANYTYDAWGRLLSVKNASGSTISDASHIANVNPIRYRGYFYDTETKLYYCNSRYYDPQVKRFINADAYVSTGQGFIGFNMFAYCGNNPVVYGDITGNMYVREAGALGSSGNWDGEATDPITKHRLDLEWKQYVIRNLHTHTTHNPKHIFSPESNSEIYIDLSDFWTDSKAIEHEKEDFFEDFVADLGTTDSDDLFEEVIYGITQVGGASGEILLGIAIVVVSPGPSKLSGVVSIWDGLVRLSDAVFEMIKKDG